MPTEVESLCTEIKCRKLDCAVPILLKRQMIPERMRLHKHACNCMTELSQKWDGPFEAISTKQVVIQKCRSNVCTLGRADLHVTNEIVNPAGEYIKHHLQ